VSLSLYSVSIFTGCSNEITNCKYDTDCKGDKVCRNSKCVGLYENIDVEYTDVKDTKDTTDIFIDITDISDTIDSGELFDDISFDSEIDVFTTDNADCISTCTEEGKRECIEGGYSICLNVSDSGVCLKEIIRECQPDEECRNGYCGKDECTEGDRSCIDSTSYTICERDTNGFLKYLNKICDIGTICQKSLCCPANMVEVKGFCMDIYEAIVSDKPDCSGNIYGQGGDNYPEGFPDNVDEANNPPSTLLFSCSMKNVLPSRFLTYMQARTVCHLSGKRLCTENEFILSCNGGNTNYKYPYGEEYQLSYCNDYPLHNVVEKSGNYSHCVSTFGVYDLSGNVEEWIYSDADKDNMYTMGGMVGCCPYGGGCTCSTCISKSAYNSSYISSKTGFRCCK